MSRKCPLHNDLSASKHHSHYCLRSQGPPSFSSSVSLPSTVQRLRRKKCRKISAAARKKEENSSASNTSNFSRDRSDLLPSIVQEIRKRRHKSSHKSTHGCSDKYRTDEGKLNINTCTEKMMKKAGLSAGLRKKVLAFRRKNKVILHMNEMWRINGMDDDWYDDLQEVLGVGEITDTLRQKAHTKSPRRCAARRSPSYCSRPARESHSHHNMMHPSTSSHHIHERHPHDIQHHETSYITPSVQGPSGLQHSQQSHSHSQHQYLHPPNRCSTRSESTNNDSICNIM